MNFVLAEDSFKGSLSSKEANETIKKAIETVFPNSGYRTLMIADGGEGTLSAIMGEDNDNEYEVVEVEVEGPLGNKEKAFYLKKENKAIVEMAMASGITLVDSDKKNPLKASSIGTGQLIAHALKNKCDDIYVGIGGSATNDGGTGAMTALGIKFLDKEGNVIVGNGENLEKIESIDDSNILPEIKRTQFTIMCDVINPLTGPMGATHVYGPQKGAVGDILDHLENGMINYQKVLESYINKDLGEVKSLGAAGGIGAAFYVFLNAEMKSGIEVLLDLNGFEKYLDDADVVITGEGKTDYQSACGKVVYGIAKRCRVRKVPVFVLSGSIDENVEKLYEVGVVGMEASVSTVMDVKKAMDNAEKYLFNATIRLLMTFKAGIEMKMTSAYYDI